ncbi:hypothetical protein BaRGS_00018682, partial [Batillaria attramentaria]
PLAKPSAPVKRDTDPIKTMGIQRGSRKHRAGRHKPKAFFRPDPRRISAVLGPAREGQVRHVYLAATKTSAPSGSHYPTRRSPAPRDLPHLPGTRDPKATKSHAELKILVRETSAPWATCSSPKYTSENPVCPRDMRPTEGDRGWRGEQGEIPGLPSYAERENSVQKLVSAQVQQVWRTDSCGHMGGGDHTCGASAWHEKSAQAHGLTDLLPTACPQ